MTILQVFAAGAGLGLAITLTMRAFNFFETFLNGIIVAMANKRATMLRLHHKHCSNCVEPMLYYCPRCGLHDEALEPTSDG